MISNISLWFWLVFPWWLVSLGAFSYTFWPFVCLIWKTVYSRSFAIFQLGYLFLCYWIVCFLVYFWLWLANVFSHSIGCLFIMLMVSFDGQELFSFDIFPLVYSHFCCQIQEIITSSMLRSFFPMFLLKFLWFWIIYLSNTFWIIFVHGLNRDLISFFWMSICSFSNTIYWRNYTFPIFILVVN